MSQNIDELLTQKTGIRLDIGGGASPQPGYVNIDVLPLPEVDIVHNLELTPWPLPDECVLQATASHVLEHITPAGDPARLDALIKLLIDKKLITETEAQEHLGSPGPAFIRVMDEVWRVLKPNGQFAFVVPYAESHGFYQDPTHCNPINETTMAYFDPLHPSELYDFYRPKPWKIEFQAMNRNGILEVLLRKREEDPSYKDRTRPANIIQEASHVQQVRLS